MTRSLHGYTVWLRSYSRGVRGAIVMNTTMGVLNVCLNLYFVFLSKRLVDIATKVTDGDILTYTLLLVAVILVRLLITAVNTRLENLTTSKMSFMIRQRLYSNLLQAQWYGKEKLHSGDTLNRLETDVDTVTKVICQDTPQFFTTVFQLLAALAFMCTMDWRLALVLVLITPVLLGFSKIFFKKMRSLTMDIRNTESKVQSHIQESLQHRIVIQSMEKGDMMEDRLDELQREEYDQVLRRTKFNVFARTVVGATFSLGYLAAFLWGVYGIYRGDITFGVMTAFLQLVGQIQGPSVRLTRQIPDMIYATASIDRLSELDDTPKEESGEPIPLNGVAGISIEDISFRYPDGDRDVIKDFSFEFKPSSKTAIIGETGVGKSTLIKLILSLLKPTKGRIVLYSEDGERVESSPMTRCNLVYVPQGNTLFSGTIRDNLLMGNPDATPAQMRDVLNIAAAEFVDSLPEGLDTLCGEQGAGLSEGQAQRIAIARGLLRPGSILLLDEFSSSLDSETETRLMTNLTRTHSEYADKTMIFITHREKISEYCDGKLTMLSEAFQDCRI